MRKRLLKELRTVMGKRIKILVAFAFTGLMVIHFCRAFSFSGGMGPKKILPVRITLFTAKYEPSRQVVSLHWVTATEKNNERFEIERSLDSTHFLVIGTARSIGYSRSPQHYYFDDPKPVGGEMFYRLREIDSSGKQFQTPVISAYKPITSLELTGIRSVNKNTELHFAIISPKPTYANVLVSDISGHVMKTFVVKMKEGANMESIYVGDLKAGVYFLQVNDTTNEGTVMGKFIHKIKSGKS
ncbi:MAG: T9SS type A sorting domain-containing protein [Chitinophagaceae bacterium]|nr:MAG: T9SS type A sorting domain-containing protein [Chitinophagaceae bacterium]